MEKITEEYVVDRVINFMENKEMVIGTMRKQLKQIYINMGLILN